MVLHMCGHLLVPGVMISTVSIINTHCCTNLKPQVPARTNCGPSPIWLLTGSPLILSLSTSANSALSVGSNPARARACSGDMIFPVVLEDVPANRRRENRLGHLGPVLFWPPTVVLLSPRLHHVLVRPEHACLNKVRDNV